MAKPYKDCLVHGVIGASENWDDTGWWDIFSKGNATIENVSLYLPNPVNLPDQGDYKLIDSHIFTGGKFIWANHEGHLFIPNLKKHLSNVQVHYKHADGFEETWIIE